MHIPEGQGNRATVPERWSDALTRKPGVSETDGNVPRQPAGLRKTYTGTRGSVTTYASSPQACHGYHYAAPKTHKHVFLFGHQGGVGVSQTGKTLVGTSSKICVDYAKKKFESGYYFVLFMAGIRRNAQLCIGIMPVSFLATYHPCYIRNGSVHRFPSPGPSKSGLAYRLLL